MYCIPLFWVDQSIHFGSIAVSLRPGLREESGVSAPERLLFETKQLWNGTENVWLFFLINFLFSILLGWIPPTGWKGWIGNLTYFINGQLQTTHQNQLPTLEPPKIPKMPDQEGWEGPEQSAVLHGSARTPEKLRLHGISTHSGSWKRSTLENVHKRLGPWKMARCFQAFFVEETWMNTLVERWKRYVPALMMFWLTLVFRLKWQAVHRNPVHRCRRWSMVADPQRYGKTRNPGSSSLFLHYRISAKEVSETCGAIFVWLSKFVPNRKREITNPLKSGFGWWRRNTFSRRTHLIATISMERLSSCQPQKKVENNRKKHIFDGGTDILDRQCFQVL